MVISGMGMLAEQIELVATELTSSSMGFEPFMTIGVRMELGC